MMSYMSSHISLPLYFAGCREYDDLKSRREKIKENRKKLVGELGEAIRD